MRANLFVLAASSVLAAFVHPPSLAVAGGVPALSTAGAKSVVPGLKGKDVNGGITSVNVSRTGRFVTFVSDATNLVKGVKPEIGKRQLFRRDRKLDKTVCFSLGTDGKIADEGIDLVSASDDGRYVGY